MFCIDLFLEFAETANKNYNIEASLLLKDDCSESICGLVEV